MQIASFILGLVSLFVFWIPVFGLLPSVAGFLLGIFGIKADKQKEGRSIGLGVAGLILNIIGVLLGILILALVFIFGSVVDGNVEFTTRAFVCQPADDDSGLETCTLEYSVEASYVVDGVFVDYNRQFLVLSEPIRGPDGPVQLNPYEPIGGWCERPFVSAGSSEAVTCQSVFRVPVGSEVIRVDYEASDGTRVYLETAQLPELGTIDDLSSAPEPEPPVAPLEELPVTSPPQDTP